MIIGSAVINVSVEDVIAKKTPRTGGRPINYNVTCERINRTNMVSVISY